MKRKFFAALTCLLLIAALFPIRGVAGDCAIGFVPNPNATEYGFDSGIYHGLIIEPPVSQGTMPPASMARDTRAIVSGAVNAQAMGASDSIDCGARPAVFSFELCQKCSKYTSYFSAFFLVDRKNISPESLAR